MSPEIKAALAAAGRTIPIVLGGGGIKGYGHMGFLQGILDLKISCGTVTGVSIGSLAAAFFKNGFSPKEMTRIFLKEVEKLGPARLSQTFAEPRPYEVKPGKLVNLHRMFSEMAREYGIRPQPGLQILAYHLLKRQPVLFTGTDYDIVKALAASCAVPGLMRPVWLGQKGGKITFSIDGWRALRENLLVDGGLHHPHPGHFSESAPALISRLGTASELPKHRLSRFEYLLHLLEMSLGRVVDRLYPDPKGHIVVRTGLPSVATMSFGVNEQKCLEMVDYAYASTISALKPQVARGVIPLCA